MDAWSNPGATLAALIFFLVISTPGALASGAPEAPPVLLAPEMTDDGVLLRWVPPMDGSDITGYEVYRMENTSRQLAGTVPGNQTHFLDTDYSPEAMNSYYVVAFNDEGSSPPSNVMLGYPRCMPAKLDGSIYPQCFFPLPITIQLG